MLYSEPLINILYIVVGGSGIGSPYKRRLQQQPSLMDDIESTSCNMSVLFIVLHGGW